MTKVRRKTLKVFIKYKPTKNTFPELIFQFLIFWCLRHISKPRVHLQEDCFIYCYDMERFTCTSISSLARRGVCISSLVGRGVCISSLVVRGVCISSLVGRGVCISSLVGRGVCISCLVGRGVCIDHTLLPTRLLILTYVKRIVP